MHILSAGILMYTSDLRFLVIHQENSENWTLQIKSPQERDSGVYECQVSTEPKMSLNYTLNVVGEWILNYSTKLTLDQNEHSVDFSRSNYSDQFYQISRWLLRNHGSSDDDYRLICLITTSMFFEKRYVLNTRQFISI